MLIGKSTSATKLRIYLYALLFNYVGLVPRRTDNKINTQTGGKKSIIYRTRANKNVKACKKNRGSKVGFLQELWINLSSG